MTLKDRYHKTVDSVKTTVSHVKTEEYLPANESIEVTPNEKYSKVLEYDEDIIGVRNFLNDNNPGNPFFAFLHYLLSLFPIIRWIYRYNLTWLYGDIIAGITTGIVAVPQSMSYAKLASLTPEYGLYSSFVGVFIYSFFATSKDVCIGPVAVMSLQVGRTIIKVVEKYPEYEEKKALIGITLALICGGIATGIGLLRLGFILEFIPTPAVMGFMTGSAFSIVVGQVPSLFGISNRLDTRASTYKVVINFFKQIGHTKVDLAFGLPPLVILFVLKYLCEYLTKRYPKYKIIWFYISVLRNGVVIIVFTAISYGCYKNRKKNLPLSLIKTVPSGLKHVGVPEIDHHVVSAIASEIPVSTIILLLEHISIAKSFGRVNNYKIDPNQELIAIGVTNIIGVFFSAYPSTGSFSRTALKAKCGVRTPIAGVFTGAVVLLALYALTDAFYWIPNATLSAVIIHAVFDLMANPRVSWQFWKVSPVEAIIFLAAVFITVFSTIEAGIYFSMCASAAFLLFRIARAHGQFLGRVEYFELIDPTIVSRNGEIVFDNKLVKSRSATSSSLKSETYLADEKVDGSKVTYGSIEEQQAHASSYNKDTIYEQSQPVSSPSAFRPAVSSEPPRGYAKKYRWVPLSLKNVNPNIKVLPPPPGVIVFRPNESFIYPNCSRQVDFVLDEVKRTTKPAVSDIHLKLGDRPWNDHGPRHRTIDPNYVDPRPLLRAIVFDMTSVPYIDATGVQNLADIRTAINKYAANDNIEYHFAGVISAWSRRALVASGFGSGTPHNHLVDATERGFGSRVPKNIELFSAVDSDEGTKKKKVYDEEAQTYEVETESNNNIDSESIKNHILLPVIGTNTPYFHFAMSDLDHLYENDPYVPSPSPDNDLPDNASSNNVPAYQHS